MHPAVEFILLLCFLVYSCLRAVFLTFVPAKWRAKKINGQICLITGAGSGIGRQLAKLFSAQHCKMILVDINKEWLEQAATECRSSGAESVNTYTCDLSDRHQVYSMTDKVRTDLGHVDILVNNAGIVSGKPLLDLDDAANIERSFKINVLSHFWLIKSFLPDMLRRQSGHIVTMASMSGIISPTTHMVDYASTKYADIGLGETLEFELHCLYRTNTVKHTLVCPYFVSTGMFHGISLKFQWLLPYMTPEYVAQKTLDAVLTNRALLILPGWLHIIACVKYMLPHSFRLHLADYLGTTGAMSTFRGRK